MNYSEMALKMHEENRGKISVTSKVKVENKDQLSTAYSPGVAEPCRRIAKNKQDIYKYTSKGNLVAVVSDGTAVLGLGDIGPHASMPVMEGKAILFKEFADVDAFPICVDTKDVDEIVDLVKNISPTFGGINLEDISAPRCMEIEKRLKEELDIPVFHDDQHGTAIVCTAGLINALKLVKKDWNNIRIVVNGAGAAGTSIVKMFLNMGAKEILVCGRHGILHEKCVETDWHKRELIKVTNSNNETGSLKDAMKGADVFIGVSAANVVTEDMVAGMNDNAIIFALANPEPEIMPDLAKKAGALVVATGRSDYDNQVNNVLAFPGIFRGALDVNAKEINEEMKVAAAKSIAGIIKENEISENYVIPNPFDKRVVEKVSNAVAEAAIRTGSVRK